MALARELVKSQPTIVETHIAKVKKGVPTVLQVTLTDESGNVRVLEYTLKHENARRCM